MQYFSEIIQSSLSKATALCWQWDVMPAFGSLLIIEQHDIQTLGIVTGLQTGSLDPSRTPFAYKKTVDELKKEQPQIFTFLRTQIEMQLVGSFNKKDQNIQYRLPERPPLIHAFVGDASDQILQIFLSKPDFLHLLSFFDEVIVDEVLLSLLCKASQKKLVSSSSLEAIIAQYAQFVGSDFRRLRVFCSRLEQIVR